MARSTLSVNTSFTLDMSIDFETHFSVGDEASSEASVFEFDGKDWTETLKESYDYMGGNSRGNRAIAVDLKTSGFDEFCK